MIFSPYLAFYCNGVTQASQVELHRHAPQQMQIWSKSGNNKGRFTLETEEVP
jgi:hypothetical protein